MMGSNILHLGYKQGFIGNPKGFARDAKATYQDQGNHYEIYVPYLHGDWNVEADCIKSCIEEGGYVALLWMGESFSVIASSENTSRLRIESKGENLSSMKWGSRVQKEGGEFFVEIHEKKQYEIITNQTEDPLLIKIIPTQVGQKIYEFIL